ncbi:hypothetical protein GMOD_00010324 [Pyrenophora seminiperda CCB06]|uniref:Uncharacterized protein n=1 Tax=Pyrenophora seminiperda CCB06 TaxID=1302712 RepID=A0A3M7M5G4_9PLEO|nr:hypothetical protein GMOD_00010324 [Pyrenophora seminiperda CCB06]
MTDTHCTHESLL